MSKIPEHRKCRICGVPMMQGYVVEGGIEYFCSEECLHKKYSEKEWEEMYDDGETDCYWTEWDEDEDEDEEMEDEK